MNYKNDKTQVLIQLLAFAGVSLSPETNLFNGGYLPEGVRKRSSLLFRRFVGTNQNLFVLKLQRRVLDVEFTRYKGFCI